jgi:hypothetical protein
MKKTREKLKSRKKQPRIEFGMSVRTKVPDDCPTCKEELYELIDIERSLLKEDDGTYYQILRCPKGHLWKVRYAPVSVEPLVTMGTMLGAQK